LVPAIETVPLAVLEHIVLPVTTKVALGNGFILTEAVSVKFTVAQPPIEALTLMVLQPVGKETTGKFNVTVPPELVTAVPMLAEL
jgi:hypothetical protein